MRLTRLERVSPQLDTREAASVESRGRRDVLVLAQPPLREAIYEGALSARGFVGVASVRRPGGKQRLRRLLSEGVARLHDAGVVEPGTETILRVEVVTCCVLHDRRRLEPVSLPRKATVDQPA